MLSNLRKGCENVFSVNVTCFFSVFSVYNVVFPFRCKCKRQMCLSENVRHFRLVPSDSCLYCSNCCKNYLLAYKKQQRGHFSTCPTLKSMDLIKFISAPQCQTLVPIDQFMTQTLFCLCPPRTVCCSLPRRRR